MNAIEILLMASYFDRQVKQGSFEKSAIGLMDVANVGSYFLPGVGTARLGYDAFQDFGRGNYLGGAANMLGAGLSLIPGAGGFLGKGVSALGRFGARGLSRINAPTLGKAFGGTANLMAKGYTGWGNMMNKVGPAMGRGAQAVARQMPTFGGNRVAAGLGRAGNMITKHPRKTQLAGGGLMAGGILGGAGSQEAAQMAQQQAQGMGDLMRSIHQRAVMTNPMYAGGRPWS